MRILGYSLIGFGLIMVVAAFTMNISVETVDAYGPIANNDLMNQRLMCVVVGTGSVIAGFLALILKAIRA